MGLVLVSDGRGSIIQTTPKFKEYFTQSVWLLCKSLLEDYKEFGEIEEMFLLSHFFAHLFYICRSRDEQNTSKLKAYELFYGGNGDCIPIVQLSRLEKAVVCGFTGPNGGITRLDLHSTDTLNTEEVAGIREWNCPPCDFVYGMSLSLYEEDETKGTTQLVNGVAQRLPHVVGEPVADVYAAVVRTNSCILAVADGVSWGKKPRLAARCAVRTAVEFISDSIDLINKTPSSSTVVDVLNKSLEACQDCIIANRATLTTLSVAMVCPLAEPGGPQWGVYVVSVGDSPVFVFSNSLNSLIELTVGSNPSSGVRDPKNSGGALGPALGVEPDLNNLSFSFIGVMPGDLILLMTDGVSDNFLETSHEILGKNGTKSFLSNTTHKNIESVLIRHQMELKDKMSAQSIAAHLMNRVVEITEERRQFNSYCIREGIDIKVRARVDQEFAKSVQKMTGKLDHATILTYQIGVK